MSVEKRRSDCLMATVPLLVGGIDVFFPYNPSGQNIDIGARIVRGQEIEGSNRKLYGVRYEQPGG